MNTLTKLSLTALAISTIAGCGYTPIKAPSTEAEMIESKSLLHVPVDVSHFQTSKLKIVADNGDEGRITVFTDPKTGKTYDLDGQPINEKGERVLTDGSVCNPLVIINNARGYGTSLNPRRECWTSAYFDFVNDSGRHMKNFGKGLAIALAVPIAAGAAAASAVGTTGALLTQDSAEGDTL